MQGNFAQLKTNVSETCLNQPLYWDECVRILQGVVSSCAVEGTTMAMISLPVGPMTQLRTAGPRMAGECFLSLLFSLHMYTGWEWKRWKGWVFSPSSCRYWADRRRRENTTFQLLPFPSVYTSSAWKDMKSGDILKRKSGIHLQILRTAERPVKRNKGSFRSSIQSSNNFVKEQEQSTAILPHSCSYGLP